MKTRFFRVVWLASVAWALFMAFVFLSGNLEQAGLLFSLSSSPSIIGLAICYIGTGSALFPKYPGNEIKNEQQ